MKICKICKLEKEFEEFYVHKAMKDGFSQKCKNCSKESALISYLKKMNDPILYEKEKQRNRNRGRAPVNKEKIPKYILNYKTKYPEKYKAKNAAFNIKIKGKHAHHWSYNINHYKDCIFLDPKEHLQVHRFLIYDQERMMYRTIEGILLDTKERHLEYILDKIKNELN